MRGVSHFYHFLWVNWLFEQDEFTQDKYVFSHTHSNPLRGLLRHKNPLYPSFYYVFPVNISISPVLNILDHCEFFQFLDQQSVIEFSLSCHSLHSIFLPNIEKNITFCVPLFILRSTTPHSFLNIYKKAKKTILFPKESYDLKYLSQVLLPITRGLFELSLFDKEILPPTITHLCPIKNSESSVTDAGNLPCFLAHLAITKNTTNLNNLPPSLCSLIFINNNTIKEYLDLRQKIYFPPSLTNLEFPLNDHCTWEIQELPKSLKKLKLGYNLTHLKLPPFLTHLTLGHDFNNPVDNLPSTLIFLKFGNNFNQPVDNLPPTLKYLKICGSFDQSVNLLPISLTHLSLSTINHIEIENFPPCLIFLFKKQ